MKLVEAVNKLVLVFNKPLFVEEHFLNFVTETFASAIIFWFSIVIMKVAILFKICCQTF